MTIAQLLLYVRTLGQLRPRQIVNRVWRRIHRPKVSEFAVAPARRKLPDRSIGLPAMERVLVDEAHFRFLNLTVPSTSAVVWNDSKLPNLWLYNLHYFDDLRAADADGRREWHSALLERWMRENPVGMGVGWDPYPISRRIVNVIKWSVRGNPLTQQLTSSLAAQTRLLRLRLEYHLGGNHLLANAKALIFAGMYFDGQEAAKWRALGCKILAAELEEQILADGGHFELSPMYHAIVLEDLLDILSFDRYAEVLPAELLATLRCKIGKMIAWLAAMTHPDGEIAFFNDSALGQSANLSQLRAYAGELGIDVTDAPTHGVTNLQQSGYLRLQNSRAVLIVDVGKVGPRELPGHAHADTLSFELSVDGKRIVVNSGTSTYATGPEREFQRSTKAHSTVEIDGKSSSEVWSAFRVARSAQPLDLAIEQESGDKLAVSCSHTGYLRLAGKPIHRRKWELQSETLRVTDLVDGQFGSAFARFYLHPACSAGPAQLCCGDLNIRMQANTPISIEASSYFAGFGVSQDSSVLAVAVRASAASVVTFDWSRNENTVLH